MIAARGLGVAARGLGVAALVLAARTAHADSPTLTPIIVLDGDYRLDPHADAEGFDGFDLARAQVGARGDLSSTVSAAALVDFAAGETVEIIDAWVDWHPRRSISFAAGYLRSPLFPSARDELVERLPVPELGTLVHALWPGRTIGVSARWRPDELPLDVMVKLGNGSQALSGNDTNKPAGDARVDYVWGRTTARVDYGTLRDVATRADDWGVRVGVGAHIDNVDDRPGATGYTAGGYQFYRPAVVSGNRYLAEAHALFQYDALQLLVEGGYTKEGRSATTSGDPTKPRTELTAVESYGVAGELSWMVTGDHRVAGAWPLDPALHQHWGGAVELAARLERATFGRCASATTECTTSVERLDADIASGAVRWWIRPEIAASVAGYYYKWDADPYDQPGVRSTWLALARLTLSIR